MFFMHHGHECGPRSGSRRWGPFEIRWEMDENAGRGRSRRRMFDSGELRLVLLKLIEEQPRHGYDLIREIEERTGGAYAPSPGVIYPTLTLLEDMGLIDEQRSEGTRKLFAITDAGRAHLDDRAEDVEALMARLADLGEMRERANGAPVRRAIRNLRDVVRHRMMEFNGERQHDIAEIIDEAARRIERLK